MREKWGIPFFSMIGSPLRTELLSVIGSRSGTRFFWTIGGALIFGLLFLVFDLSAQEAKAEGRGGDSAAAFLKGGNRSISGDSVGESNEESALLSGKKRVKVDEGITFWLLDRDGKWKIPLPNWSIEDVARSLDSFGRRTEELPYTIQSLNAVGNAEEDSVRLTIEFRINTRDDSVVRVPLGLKEGIYIPDSDPSGTDRNFHYDGPGSAYLDIDRQSGGYVAVIQNVTRETDDVEKGGNGDETRVVGEKSEEKSDGGESPDETSAGESSALGESSDETPVGESSASGNSPDEPPAGESSVSGESSDEPPVGESSASGESPDETPVGESSALGESPDETPVGESSASGESSDDKTSNLWGAGKDAESHEEVSSASSSSTDLSEENLLDLLGPENEKVEDRFIRQRHLVKMTLFFRIDSPSEEEHRLRVSFPSSIASKVRLDVPIPDIQLTVSEGTVALAPVNLNETTSEMTLTGLSRTGAATELIWRKKESRVSEIPSVLQVENAVIAANPGEQGIQYDVTLPVRSYGESLNLIRVRFPADTHPIGESIQAVGRDNAQLRIRWEEKIVSGETIQADAASETESSIPEEMATDSGETGGEEVSNQTVLEIRLAQPSDFASLHFKAVAQSVRNDSGTEKEGVEATGEWECVGFEVIGAQRQSGRLSIQVPDETEFDLVPENGVRNSTFTPENEDDKTEFFTFFTQPFSLRARPIQREARVSVVPEYQILIQDGQIKMAARFRYTVHGAPLRLLRLKTAGWFINEFDKDGPIDSGKIYLDPETNELTLPLKSAADGEIDVQWSAVREFKLNQDILEIPIPTVLADWIDPAVVAVVPDDHIELVPLPGRFVDLVQKRQRSLHLTLDLPKRQQSPLVYQVLRTSKADEGKNPLFAAKVVHHEQKIRVGSETAVQLLNQPNDMIQQTLDYRIEYVPLKTISLIVPPELRDHPDLTINVDGKPVSSRNIVTEPFGEAEPELFRKRIHLPDDGVIGQCEVTLRYPVGKIELFPQRTNHIPLHLTVPEDGTFETNRLTVNTLPGIEVFQPESSGKTWEMEEGKSDETLNRREYHFTARRRERQIALRAIVKGEGTLGSTVIERLWIQTWLNAESRFERIACRVVSNQDSFLIRLPGQVRQDQLEIKLDGVPYLDGDPSSEIIDSENRIEIRPNPLQKKKSMVLEISYLIPVHQGRFGDRMAFADFDDPSVWIRRCYWQVILPKNKHLFGEPEKWTPEFYDLTWSGFFFRRVASMETKELGTWIGLPSVENVPDDANVYLFSSFDPPKTCRLKIIDRALLILFGSGCFLAFGLTFIYCPRFRYGEAVLLVFLLSIGIFLFRPVVVLVYLQTSVIGVVLTIFAYVFKRFLGRKSAKIPISREASDIRDVPSVPEEASSSKSSQLAEEK